MGFPYKNLPLPIFASSGSDNFLNTNNLKISCVTIVYVLEMLQVTQNVPGKTHCSLCALNMFSHFSSQFPNSAPNVLNITMGDQVIK